MKIKYMVKGQWDNLKWGLVTYYGMILLMYLLQTSMVFNMRSAGDIFTMGSDIGIGITVFIFGIVTFATALRFGIMHGVSRKTIFLSSCILASIIGIVCAAGSIILNFLIAITPMAHVTKKSGSIFTLVYHDALAQMHPAAEWLLSVLWVVVLTACMLMVGFSVGGVFYRLGRIGRIVWAAGLPTALFMLLPLLVSLLPTVAQDALWGAADGFVRFLGAAPINLLLALAVVMLVFAAINWLLMRRAPLKAA